MLRCLLILHSSLHAVFCFTQKCSIFLFCLLPVDNVWAMMIIWRITGKTVRIVLCCIVYLLDGCPHWRGNFEGEKGPVQDMPGNVCQLTYSKQLSRGQNQYGVDADWGVLYGIHIGTRWRIRLNCPCVAAMQPYVKLLWSVCHLWPW